MTPLVCPYCRGELEVITEERGLAYLHYTVVEAIECTSWPCSAAWEPDGTPRKGPRPA